jgi:hypothetical protein
MSTDQKLSKTEHQKEYMKEYQKKNADQIKETQKKYKKKNAERIKAHQKTYHEKNADQIKETKKKYNEKNADRIKETQKEYQKKNADQIKEYQKKYRAKNADQIKEYQKKNPNKHKEVMKKYRTKNADQIKETQKEYREKNADKIKEYMKKYREKNTEQIKEDQKECRKKSVDNLKEFYKKNTIASKDVLLSNFKLFHSIRENIELRTKVEDEQLFVLYHLKWIPITQVKNRGKPYSRCSLFQKYGSNLLHALKMVENISIEEELEPWFYDNCLVYQNNKIYTVHEDGSVSMGFRNGWIHLRKLMYDLDEDNDEVLKEMYGEYLEEITQTFVEELYRLSKRTTDIVVDLLELEKVIKKEQKCSFESLFVSTYFGTDRTDMCPICLKNIVLCEKVIKTNCDHLFHAVCIVKWMEDQPACPCCRTDFHYQEMVIKSL